MTPALRFLLAGMAVSLLAACASGVQSSGVGIRDVASLEPSQEIGGGPLTPQSLLGVAPEALSARLGAPAFRRAEPQAEVWQYGGEGCSLFVYFYKTDAGALASTFVDARKAVGGPADPAACLADVVAKKSVPVS